MVSQEKKVNVKSLFLAFLLTLLLLSGCTIDSNPSTSVTPDMISAHLKVSSDFGREALFDKQIRIPEGTSALEAMQRFVKVDTAYGGGFVTSVENIKSGYLQAPPTRKDWFLYVNGILARSGGLGYIVEDGDTVHWYYRDWSFRQSVSAIVSDFPEPFIHGYEGLVRPTIILYQGELYEQALRLYEFLQGMGANQVSALTEDEITQSERQSANLLVVGNIDFGAVADVFDIWDRVGLYTRAEGGKIITYDSAGKPVEFYSSETGIILCMQNPYNPRGTGACENVLWLISGTDLHGVGQALNLLTADYQRLNHAAGIVSTAGTTLFVP